jgi:putative cell wall-binding protein
LKDQRKRVAKRLASGLLAGALALGGLAISGGTASANTPSSPSTNRIAGADRYETAVAIARSQLGTDNPTGGIIFVSGENPVDALAAATLNNNNNKIVTLSVKKDSVPSAVSDFIADYKASIATGSVKVWVIGGESAISKATFDAIKAAVTTVGSLTPPVVTRVSGDDRYATAKAISDIAGVTDANDTLIIANGEDNKWADALSAGPLAAENEWPLALTTSTGLNASAQAKILSLFATPGSLGGKYLIIGGPASVPTSVEDYIISLGVPPSSIQRIAGADRYQTNLLVQLFALGTGFGTGMPDQLAAFGGNIVALASGETPFDALAAAGWAAAKDAHLVLTPTVGGNLNTLTLAATLAGFRDMGLATNGQLWVIGGRSAVADTAKTAYVAGSSTNLTSTLICPTVGLTTGGQTLILDLSGRLSVAQDLAFSSISASAALFKKNTVSMATPDVGEPFDAAFHFEPSRKTYAVTLAAVPLAGTTFTFSGWTEGTAAGAYTPTRSIASSSCTVAADTSRPTVSMRAIPGSGFSSYVTSSAGPRILVSSNERVSISSAADNLWIDGVPTSLTTVVTDLSGVGTLHLIQLNNNTTISALSTVELRASAVKDRAGNAVATTVAATAAADTTAPTITVDGVSNTAASQARYVVGSLSVSAAALGKWDGANGSSFTIKVTNQRGLVSPKIVIDETAKTIVVTADTGYHTVADVSRAALNAGLTTPGLGAWKVGVATGKAASDKVSANLTAATCGLTCGTSTVIVSISGSEAFTLASAGVNVTVNGLGVPFVTTPTVTDSRAFDPTTATNAADDLQNYNDITFTTSFIGSGVMSFVGTADGVNDVAGNRIVAPVTFTIS